MTIRHLLTHTGGVPDYFDDADWFIHIWEKENRVPGNSEILRFLCETKAKPYGALGEKFVYSQTGYNLLALLVERLSGVPFENYARATVYEDGRFVADVDSEEDRDVTAFDGLNGDDYVYTNIFDMLKWDRVLREGSILTHEEQRMMYTPVALGSGETFEDEDGDELEFRLYPIGENEFGRKGGMIRLTFSEGCLKYGGFTCKKVEK